MTYCLAVYDSPIGMLTLESCSNFLTGLWIKGQKHDGSAMEGKYAVHRETPVLTAAKQWLDDYFSGRRPLPDIIDLKPEGSPFRQMVWQILCRIPYGQVRTYGDIAAETAARCGRDFMSPQAVGGAVGHNPISIIIPCHRVVGAKGNLTGYAGGIEKKAALLQREGVDISRFRL